jgi:hypothetical protein
MKIETVSTLATSVEILTFGNSLVVKIDQKC